jgi:hypothetical protein
MTIFCADLVCNEEVLEIISRAKVEIIGAKGLGLEAIGSNRGGPLDMTGGEIGLLLDITIQCSTSSCQGNSSIYSINQPP